jgi:sugar phosphate isomerase/epimerase
VKIGVVSDALDGMALDEGLAFIRRLGVEAIELACAGWFQASPYCDLDVLTSSSRARRRWHDAYREHRLEISALAIHGQPLSPDRDIARSYHHQFEQACQLAESIGVRRLTLLAGLPEGAPGDSSPSWIVSAFPPSNQRVLEWQWEERLLPYWIAHARIAADHGCLLCFELHPSDMLHHPAALLQLRDAVGETVGCNFDPAHLFWQGVDPLEAIGFLGSAIYHVHAKDLSISPRSRVSGVLDATPFSNVGQRAWSFRSVGQGHDDRFWLDFVNQLCDIGYDDVLSIEHEDPMVGPKDGLVTSVAFLQHVLEDS